MKTITTLTAEEQAVLDEACCIVAEAALAIEAEPVEEVEAFYAEPEEDTSEADAEEARLTQEALAVAGAPMAGESLSDWLSRCICR